MLGQHIENMKTHYRLYWTKDLFATDKERAEIVELRPLNQIHYSGVQFKWPAEMRSVEILENLLFYSFKAGKKAKEKQIREALGLKE